MIEGLKVDVPSTVLRERFSARKDFHAGRAEFYLAKLKAFEDAEEQARVEDPGMNITSYQTNNPRQAFEQSRKSHLYRRDLYEFLAKHVAEAEVFRLGVEDLSLLEFS